MSVISTKACLFALKVSALSLKQQSPDVLSFTQKTVIVRTRIVAVREAVL